MESSPLIQSTYNAAVTLLLGNCDYRDSFGPVECFGARIKHLEVQCTTVKDESDEAEPVQQEPVKKQPVEERLDSPSPVSPEPAKLAQKDIVTPKGSKTSTPPMKTSIK